MGLEQPPDGLTMTPHRLARIVEEFDRLGPAELEALLSAITRASWPTSRALNH
ncbi:MAG TPA: hypothetical protein VNV44_10775 [Solirubrobacteraceae bacterium]|jgi:hypothetical protein|nr:hypothetical protein [Solirubrobacteraceae bacterium]